MTPVSAVCNGGVTESKVKDGEEVYQAIKAGVLFAADTVVTDQITIYQVFQQVGEFLSRTN